MELLTVGKNIQAGLQKNFNMAGKGGKREGAGRPKSLATIRAQKFKERISEEIAQEAKEWIASIRDLALGHFVEVRDENGNVQRVYKKSPDARAWKIATERAFGKPVQPLASDPENPFEVSHVISAKAQHLLNELQNDEDNQPENMAGEAGASPEGREIDMDTGEPKAEE